MEGRGGFTDALDCGQEGRKETRGEQVGESEIDQQGHVPPRRAFEGHLTSLIADCLLPQVRLTTLLLSYHYIRRARRPHPLLVSSQVRGSLHLDHLDSRPMPVSQASGRAHALTMRVLRRGGTPCGWT